MRLLTASQRSAKPCFRRGRRERSIRWTSVCKESVENLNQLLADTMTLRDLYKKHHWQVAAPPFYQLHLVFDKHHDEQNELVDTIAERIQTQRRQYSHGPRCGRDDADSTRAERP
ncbi:MAG TPA: ferritin-like domain-containing protein [Vicinamibacterales bacterium]|nr:ferritin-like domain-containing protein [Vicinamibacterales bacterium]